MFQRISDKTILDQTFHDPRTMELWLIGQNDSISLNSDWKRTVNDLSDEMSRTPAGR